jgi:hypothetical protein
MVERARRPIVFDAGDLRGAAAAMLAAGLVLPLAPGHAGLPCPLRTLTGIPCPLCGMTTSVEATVHLDLRAALAANPAGVPAVLAGLVLLLRRPRRPFALPAWVVVALLGAMWVFELHRFSLL